MIVIRRVAGNSMLPTLRPGQIVIGWRYGRIKPGDLVVLHHHDMDKIKRVSKIKDGRVFVLGDNPKESSDSRNFGWVPYSTITAKVLLHL